MDSVLVTGGAGYIGAHACKALAEAGYRPIAYDNLSRGHRSAVQWGPLVEAPLQSQEWLVAALRQFKVTAVMHFAAHSYVGESVTNPELYYQNNFGGTLCLLEAMKATDVRRLVFSSTCAIYGIPAVVPIPEATATMPLSPYGETKLAVERALHWYGNAYGFKYAALRFFNAAGADLNGDIGEDHNPETHLIPLVLRAMLEHGNALQIFGDDYPTPDGTAIRDYIHVTDLADAHVLALRHLIDGGDSLALNLGTGKGYSVREIITAAARIGKQPVPHHIGLRRAGDPPELVADSTLARSLLGWKPRCSDLDTIIQTALDWASKGLTA